MERVNETPLSILVVANQDATSDWIQTSLQELKYKVVGMVESIHQALQVMERTRVDIILADGSAHGVSEIGWIQTLAVRSVETVVLVIATSSEMEFVRQAMLAGAQGFLLKPFDLPELHQLRITTHQYVQERILPLSAE